MKNRRTFLKNTILGSLALGYTGTFLHGGLRLENPMMVPETYNPWIELSRSAYLRNAKLISEKANNKGILAVLKNNAYGLGDVEVAQILDESPFVHGFALVNDKRCLALRTHGVKKAILLMGDFDEDLGLELVQNNITLSAFSMESTEKIIRLASIYSGQVLVELY
ncbi:MAG: alanine racemase, partial [Bacteroidota bacterium]